MTPQMGVVTDADLAAAVAAHNALTIVHGTVDDVADQTDIETHRSDLDAHTRSLHELIRTGTYASSELMTSYRGVNEDTIVADRLYAMAYPMSRDRTPDEIFVDIQTGSAGDFVRIGLYADNGNCYPGALIADIGAVDVTAVGLKTLAYTTQLVKGLYWIADISDGTPKISSSLYRMGISGDLARGYEQVAAWIVAQAYGALPANYPAGGIVNTRLHHVGFKWASND